MGGGLRGWTSPPWGSITWELREIVVRGLWRRSISLYGSSVRGTWREGSFARGLEGYEGKALGMAFLFMGAQLGNLEWAHLPGTLRYG